MTDQQHTTAESLTEEQLAAIEARTTAATPGPWSTDSWEIYQGSADDTPSLMKWIGETCRPEDEDGGRADAEFIAHARTDMVALLAEARSLRSERDELRRQYADSAASLAEQVLRYGQRQREHNADREELEQLRTALTEIRHLHKDSPMGPCPLCIDPDAAARGDDPTIPYPCPTARLAGAKDCEPPHVRAAAEEPAACAKCRTPFDPTDPRSDGRSQYPGRPYCRICVNRCHDTEIADHRCVICAPETRQ